MPGVLDFFLFLGLNNLRDELLRGKESGCRDSLAPGQAASATSKTVPDVVAISHLQLPQPHVASSNAPVRRLVEVLIWVARIEPG
jgi:hypothetical protein